MADRRATPDGDATQYFDAGVEVWSFGGGLLDEPIYPESEGVAIEKYEAYGVRVAAALPWLAPDIVHLHDLFGWACALAARTLGKPVHLHRPSAA